MKGNKVEKLETSIYVLCGRDELIRMFPKTNVASSMTIFHHHEVIHVESSPSGDLHRILPILKKYVPTLSFIVNRFDRTSEYYIKIDEISYDVYNTDKPDQTRLDVISYDDDLDQHYQHVDKLKIALNRRGIQVKDSHCEVTRKIRC